MVTLETKIRPQTLLLKVSSSPSELIPSFTGMLWIDPNYILRVDTIGGGVPIDFVTVLPEHTTDGHHGPKVTITQTATDNALVISKNNAGSAVQISCGSGAGNALNITQLGAANAVSIINNGTGVGVSIDQTGSGNGLVVTKSAGDGSSVVIINNYDPCVGLYITRHHSGSGNSIRVEHSGSSSAIAINMASTTPISATGLDVVQQGFGSGLNVRKSTNNSPGANALNVFNSSNGCALLISQTINVPAYAALFVDTYNAGLNSRAVRIDHRGTNSALYINKVVNEAGPAIEIANAGSGYDVKGHNDNWHFDKNGNAKIGGNTTIGGNATISGNATLSGSANVNGSASIGGNVVISGNASTMMNAVIFGNATVSNNVTIGGNATASSLVANNSVQVGTTARYVPGAPLVYIWDGVHGTITPNHSYHVVSSPGPGALDMITGPMCVQGTILFIEAAGGVVLPVRLTGNINDSFNITPGRVSMFMYLSTGKWKAISTN